MSFFPNDSALSLTLILLASQPSPAQLPAHGLGVGGECFVGFDQGATGASFASNYQDIDGIIVPMSRRVFAYDAAGMKVDSPLVVSIDFHSVAWRKDQVLGRAGCDFNGHWVTGGFPEKIQSLLMGSTSPACR